MSIGLEFPHKQEIWQEDRLAQKTQRAMQSWLPYVQRVSQWVHQDRQLAALSELVRWYERVCSQEGSADAAPLEGLDALVDELTCAPPYESMQQLSLVRWALRVSEELVQWRANLAAAAAPARVAVCEARLELALSTALRYFGAESNSDAQQRLMMDCYLARR